MPILSTTFIISQIAMFIAMGFDFMSMQFKKREITFICLMFSAILISSHYFLLDKITAGIITTFSIFRFATCYFTTSKKLLLLFIALNTISLFFTFSSFYDLIFYIGITIFIIGNFQSDNQLMRKIMMVGTSLIIIYNAIIFSPMGVIVEGSFLISNFVGYYRHYIKTSKSII